MQGETTTGALSMTTWTCGDSTFELDNTQCEAVKEELEEVDDESFQVSDIKTMCSGLSECKSNCVVKEMIGGRYKSRPEMGELFIVKFSDILKLRTIVKLFRQSIWKG